MAPPTNRQHPSAHVIQGPPPVEQWDTLVFDDTTFMDSQVSTFLTKTPAHVILNQNVAVMVHVATIIQQNRIGITSSSFPNPLFKQWAWNFAPDGVLKDKTSLSTNEKKLWHYHMDHEQAMLHMAGVYARKRLLGEAVDAAAKDDQLNRSMEDQDTQQTNPDVQVADRIEKIETVNQALQDNLDKLGARPEGLEHHVHESEVHNASMPRFLLTLFAVSMTGEDFYAKDRLEATVQHYNLAAARSSSGGMFMQFDKRAAKCFLSELSKSENWSSDEHNQVLEYVKALKFPE